MADAFNLLQIYQDDDDDDDDDDITSVPENHHQPDDVEDKYSPLAGHNSIIEHNAVKDSDTDVQDDGVDISDEHRKDIDQLDNFLPPPQQQKCLDVLQEKIIKFFAYKRQGKSFNVEVRNRKYYRNPDFLHHAVRYQDIDEIGSCFSKDVFDPHGYDESDFYDAVGHF